MLYYLWVTSASLGVPGAILVDYSELARNPEMTVQRCAEGLGMSFGPSTPGLIAQVRERPPAVDTSVMPMLSEGDLQAVQCAWELWQENAQQAERG